MRCATVIPKCIYKLFISCPVWWSLCTKRLISIIFLSTSPLHSDGQQGLHPVWFTSCQMGCYLLSLCYFPLIQSVFWKIISRNKATSGSVCDAVHDSCPLERTINAKWVHKQTQTRRMSSNGCSALPALIEAGLDEHMHVRRSTVVEIATLAHTCAAVAWHCRSSSETKPCRSIMHYPLQTARAQCNQNLSIKMDSFSTLCIYRQYVCTERMGGKGAGKGEGIRGGGVGNDFHGMSLRVCENAHHGLARKRQCVLNWERLLLGLSWQPLNPTSTTTRTPPHFVLV